ncbi:uncharacterized protein LOC115755403 [Rhodamnia argentea]|uniref:ADP-ribosyl cyclase/cyclic ADP-ribose hydrolase n=1 Tax=Rhodamnia argentea TaxID=178133 RepID=A0A8B8QTV5_9MYRT|nr:uncharacterized protein LOC115755403 [Rhodamnia argentea]
MLKSEKREKGSHERRSTYYLASFLLPTLLGVYAYRFLREKARAVPRNYDVFLSFRGGDTRTGFTDFLYNSLVAAGVRVFRDDDALPVGEEIGPELLRAINSCRIAIPIISEQYAESKWCLRELTEIMECHDKHGLSVFPVFYMVDVSDVARQFGKFGEALRKHELQFSSEVQGWQKALFLVTRIRGWSSQTVANGYAGELVKMMVATVLSELKTTWIERLPIRSVYLYFSEKTKRESNWQVFLSFHGPDTRSSFAAYLYVSLVAAGISVFNHDDPSLIGRDFRDEIWKAIEHCKISIPILSKSYVSSHCCLHELARMVDCKRTKGQKILPIFFEVKRENMLRHRELVDGSTCERWEQALREVGSSKGWVSEKIANGDQGVLVKRVVKEVSRLSKNSQTHDPPMPIDSPLIQASGFAVEIKSGQEKRSTVLRNYDVYLSFRGGDTPTGFTDFLYNSLVAAGVHVFRDYDALPVDEEIGQELLWAIRTCRIAIPIISQQYAQSKWCLRVLAEMMDCHRKHGKSVFPVFYNVLFDDVVCQRGNFKEAFWRHEKQCSSEEVLEWWEALSSVACIKGWMSQTIANGQEGELVKTVVAKVLSELDTTWIERLPIFIRSAYLYFSEKKRRQTKWHVFLNYRGPDTRRGFAAYLYISLVAAKIKVFSTYDPSLIGTYVGCEIQNAIDHCKISIPILSENYASSCYCLDELAQMVECKRTKGQKIMPIFYKVKPSNVRDVSHRFGEDMRLHKELVNEIAYERWERALREVGSSKGWVSEKIANGHEGVLVKRVVKEVSRLLNNPQTHEPPSPSTKY